MGKRLVEERILQWMNLNKKPHHDDTWIVRLNTDGFSFNCLAWLDEDDHFIWDSDWWANDPVSLVGIVNISEIVFETKEN